MGGFELKGERLCGCLCMSIAFPMRWPHTMAELKVASPFKREQYARSPVLPHVIFLLC